jgi:hypothetical protein
MSLGPVGIQHLDRWRPQSAEALEGFWLFFDVDLDWDVVVIDESLDACVGVHLGIQPSTSSSHRSCVEVYQHRAFARPRFGKCNINVILPCDRHNLLLSNLIGPPGSPT